jgi:two-component system, chemotaxis family, chemotaxis protein CheY
VSGDAAGFRVLIVEDSPTVRLTIRQALEKEGMAGETLWEAETAHHAIELFEKHKPNVVFLDITLPEGSRPAASGAGFLDFLATGSGTYDGGHKVAREMLNRDPGLKVLVCSGNPKDDPRVRELIQAGAFTFLEKPIRLTQLREALRQLRAEMEPGEPRGG